LKGRKNKEDENVSNVFALSAILSSNLRGGHLEGYIAMNLIFRPIPLRMMPRKGLAMIFLSRDMTIPDPIQGPV